MGMQRINAKWRHGSFFAFTKLNIHDLASINPRLDTVSVEPLQRQLRCAGFSADELCAHKTGFVAPLAKFLNRLESVFFDEFKRVIN